MKNQFLCLLAMVFIFPFFTSANEIALTFDDAPRRDGPLYTSQERSQQIVQVLKKHDIQAAFFVSTKAFDRSGTKEIIQKYSSEGHIIANHSHKHMHYDKNSVTSYKSDFDRAHKELEAFSNFRRWFRFPMLKEGNTEVRRDAMREHLRKHNYRNGYVTIDNHDYYLSYLLKKNIKANKKVNLGHVCRMFVDVMWDSLQFYDALAKQYVGQVKHIMLGHENDLQALCLERFIESLRTRNWQIISPDQAYSDELLSREPNTLYLGQGRIAAYVHEITGQEFRSKWEDNEKLEKEFERRCLL